MDKKVYAVLVSFMMIAISGAIMIDDSTDASENAPLNNNFGIHFMVDSNVTLPPNILMNPNLNGIQSGWKSFETTATDGCKALCNVLSAIGTTASCSIDENYTVTEPYFTNNLNYGKITKLFNLTEDGTNSFNIYVYKDSQWVSGVNAVGLYQTFDDYVNQYVTADIAIYYGPSTTTPSFSNITTKPLTAVPSSQNDSFSEYYKVTFTFIRTGPNGQSITTSAIGYGSNGFKALENALGTDSVTGVVGSSDFATYGWITTLFGIGTVLVDDKGDDKWENDVYSFWNLYYDGSQTTTPSWQFSNLTTAFYCPLDNSAFSCDNFKFVYA